MKLGVCLSIFLLVTLVSAQVVIQGPRSLELLPGQAFQAEYTLINQGVDDAQVTLFMNDYAQLPDGSLQQIAPKSLPQSLFHVAEFAQLEWVVPASSSLKVPLAIDLPSEGPAGYWGIVGVDAAGAASDQGLGLNVRYAMVTALSVTGQKKQDIYFENFTSLRQDENLLMALTLRNNGSGYERYTLELSFQPNGGEAVKTEVQSVIVPGISVDLLLPVPAELAAGTYGVFATVIYADELRTEAVTAVTIDP